MHWYLVHTKPRQEKCALQNLKQQGYECYLPTLPSEKLRQGLVTLNEQPLFPRYLFIRLGMGLSAQSWGPIRSTRGVSRLVRFGGEPAKVDDGLVALLQRQESEIQHHPRRLFEPGDQVRLTEGAFAGLEGIYQIADGDRRVIVLIEMMSKPVALKVALTDLQKVN